VRTKVDIYALIGYYDFNVYKGLNAYVTVSQVVFFYFDDFNLTIISIHFFQTVSAVQKDLFD
jgi:hypothetical protein